MRRVRQNAGVSLRTLERDGAWRRSTMSQVETARAHPSRELVAWYDDQFRTDGLLLSIYAEARSRQLLARDGNGTSALHVSADGSLQQLSTDPAPGAPVPPGTPMTCRIALANTGREPWAGYALRRMGAYDGGRLLSSHEWVPVPDTAAGAEVAIDVDVRTPERHGVVVAFWSLVDADGREQALSSPPISVLLVVR